MRRRNHKILESLAKTWEKWPDPRQNRAGLEDGRRAPATAARKSGNFGVLSKNVGKMAGSRTETGRLGGRLVRQEFTAACAVAELARVQTGGDELNSGEFSYPPRIVAAPRMTGVLPRAPREKPGNFGVLSKNVGKMARSRRVD